jgi:hypothetical protein
LSHALARLIAYIGLRDVCKRIESLAIDPLIKQFSSRVADRYRHEQRITKWYRCISGSLRPDAFLASRLLSVGCQVQAGALL